METTLRIVGLRKYYGSFPALDGIDLELPQGQIIGLLGPNGSGKTTLLKLCAGLLTPNAGSITVCGEPIGPDSKALVSYLPDRTYFTNGQRVQELVDLFEDFYEDFDRERAEQMLLDLGIGQKARFGALSKGNREKVQLVLVMSRRARLYLLDEPIGGVDPAARDYILHTILRNYDPEATVLISTHLIADVEPVLNGYIFLHQGHIISAGNAEQARATAGTSLDEMFREVFRCFPSY